MKLSIENVGKRYGGRVWGLRGRLRQLRGSLLDLFTATMRITA
ncbi:MAG: hypothetical protein ACRD2Y_13980 [Terriglobales bacterium]